MRSVVPVSPEKPKETLHTLVAELCIRMGRLNPEELAGLLERCSRTSLDVGIAVVSCGRLTLGELEQMRKAAQFILDKRLSITRASLFLRECYLRRCSIEQIMARTEFRFASAVSMIVIASGFVELEEISKISKVTEDESASEITGYDLFSEGLISFDTWKLCVERVQYLHMGVSTVEEVSVERHRQSLEKILWKDFEAAEVDVPRLGELVLRANVVVEPEILRALENGFENDEPLGKLLVQGGLVSQLVINAAIILQGMIRDRILVSSQAVEVLQIVHSKKIPLPVVLAELTDFKEEVLNLLVAARAVPKEVLDEGLARSRFGFLDADLVLVEQGCVSRESLRLAAEVWFQLKRANLSEKEAARVLRTCVGSNVPVNAAKAPVF